MGEIPIHICDWLETPAVCGSLKFPFAEGLRGKKREQNNPNSL